MLQSILTLEMAYQLSLPVTAPPLSQTVDHKGTTPVNRQHSGICGDWAAISVGRTSTAAASWTNSGASGEVKHTAAAVASDGDKPEER